MPVKELRSLKGLGERWMRQLVLTTRVCVRRSSSSCATVQIVAQSLSCEQLAGDGEPVEFSVPGAATFQSGWPVVGFDRILGLGSWALCSRKCTGTRRVGARVSLGRFLLTAFFAGFPQVFCWTVEGKGGDSLASLVVGGFTCLSEKLVGINDAGLHGLF